MATTCSESSINYECLLILLLFLESMWSFLAKANICGFFLCVAIKNLDLFTYCSWHASFCDFGDLRQDEGVLLVMLLLLEFLTQIPYNFLTRLTHKAKQVIVINCVYPLSCVNFSYFKLFSQKLQDQMEPNLSEILLSLYLVVCD